MKNLIITASVFIAVLLSSLSSAQGVYLTGFGGYTFQDKTFGYSADVVVSDGAAYGGVLSFRPASNKVSLDLTYSWQGADFNVTDYSSSLNRNYTVPGSVNYIMIGGSHSPDFTAKVAPYGGMMLGAAIISPQENYDDVWRFAVGGKLGAILHFNERVGFMIQTQLMIPVQGFGIGVGCSGSGCGTGVSTTSSFTQFGFTGGIELKLK
jgi:hypothetical protein